MIRSGLRAFSMYRIALKPPLVEAHRATFRWHVEPETALYRKASFTLKFPESVRLSDVPPRLWWDILLLCLHSHWLLLRPCEIRIPLKLAARERQFWIQLLQNGADTIAAHGPEQSRSRPLDIAIVDGELDLPRTTISGLGFGTAFSSGKDSLLQTGLLCELTELPLLVTTTSPMPPLEDHETQRRRDVLAAIQQRRRIRFVEVVSDFRRIWDNGFAGRMGYPIAINELTDTFLYMSSLLAAGAALGATRLFVASEAEVQVNGIVADTIVQHPHFMYSAATQRALARLLAPYGIRFGSLTWPLYSMQVQQLLWARYPDMCDLQYSCWRVRHGEAACSECKECFHRTLIALADRQNPERMGIDLPKILAYAPAWEALLKERPAESVLPRHHAGRRVDAYMMDAVRRVSLVYLAFIIARGHGRRIGSRRVLDLLQDFRQFQNRARRFPRQPRLGVREAFFEWLDPELRDALTSIYTRYFPVEPRREHFGIFERSRTLTQRAASLLD
jgi:hypothetical protein